MLSDLDVFAWSVLDLSKSLSSGQSDSVLCYETIRWDWSTGAVDVNQRVRAELYSWEE